VGRGSCFHFTVGVGVTGKTAESPAPGEVSLDGLQTLVVDDNMYNRRILADLVSRWGMRAVQAENAVAALGELAAASRRGNPFALVLTDVHMPGMDGFELADQIRHSPHLAGATILMLTSAERAEDLARCRELGISSYLIKPVRRSELYKSIVAALNHRPSALPAPVAGHPRPGVTLDESPEVLERILLAEDNIVNQRLAMRLLEKAGYRVTVANNGREALEELEREPFDLVVMDVQMPEMDGLEATAAIRSREKISGRHIPIIAMTAHALKGDEERCLQAGMDAYIAKPIRSAELLELVERHCHLAPALA
jgi:two-component system sensor histidine kinase/response regulator